MISKVIVMNGHGHTSADYFTPKGAQPLGTCLIFPDKEDVKALTSGITKSSGQFRDAKSFAKHDNLSNHFKHHVAVCDTTATIA